MRIAKSDFKSRLRDAFIDKQIYIRSTHAVHYIYFSTRSQIALSVLAVGFSLWVGFATVNVIYKDEIAETRDRDMQQMRIAYEEKLNRLQLAYDNLNGELTLARDWFNETATDLEKRHRLLNRAIEQNDQVTNDLRAMQQKFANIADRANRRKNRTELLARNDKNTGIAYESRDLPTLDGDMKLALVDDLKTQTPDTAENNSVIPHVSEDITTRMHALKLRQQDTLDALEEETDAKITEYADLINATRVINVDELIARIEPESQIGTGGPFIPLENDERRNGLDKQIYRIMNNLDELSTLTQSVASLPLAMPIHHHNVTSDFGPRLDPIRKRPAFHSGIDFGTAIGTPIYAPLGGRVVIAGLKGPYGKTIEIDHGNGFKTRYGHLNAIRVRKGDMVDFQQLIGEAGNTGRSTGPHLHYEIWFDGKVRNPAGFLDAGQHIFNTAEK